VQASSLVLGVFVSLPPLLSWIFGGGLTSAIASGSLYGFVASLGVTDVAGYAVVAMFGPIWPVAMCAAMTTFIVFQDVLDGRYDPGAARFVQGNPAKPTLTWWQRISIASWQQWDMATLAEPTVMLFGMIPELLATWSLIWRGTAFEYLVAEKPKTQSQE